MMGPEPVRKSGQKRAPVSMKLPLKDDGRVHPAAGMRPTTSAAHYADASMIGDAVGGKMETTSGS